MAFPTLGQEVILTGTITAIFCTETTEPSRQAFNVRLKDGQAVHTNIDNIYFYEEMQTEIEPEEAAPDAAETDPSAAVVPESDPSDDPAPDASTAGDSGDGGSAEPDAAADAPDVELPTDDPAPDPTA